MWVKGESKIRFLDIINGELFPIIQNRAVEKIINKKIDKIASCDSEDIFSCELEYIQFDDNTKIYNVKDAYDNSINRIIRFEDKAKSNLVAISISVTVMLGLIEPINKIYEKYNNIGVKGIGTILCFAIVFFMINAGILSLKVLMEKNIVYKVSISELNDDDDCMKKIYGQNAELNEMKNTVRNNYINTSFRCIRNALILLSVIFMMGIIPIGNDNKIETKKQINKLQESINEVNNKIIKLEIYNSSNGKIIDNQKEKIECLEEDMLILKYKIDEIKQNITEK